MTSNDYLLIPKLMAEGENGNLTALTDAFTVIKAVESEGAQTILPNNPRELPQGLHE
jgi:hypothetical protein